MLLVFRPDVSGRKMVMTPAEMPTIPKMYLLSRKGVERQFQDLCLSAHCTLSVFGNL
jgi:hypothetical protein